ncbi:nuclear transport factor 2 family protein [Parafrankia discariae]|uniref:nuclear transport factor 2 family protein n=1 Tax=Parafrankia discariae TaxID=365528 RepID=UPI00035E586A|nr:nuclear transport factor 2 family protein [Parafrankia discariae]
MDDFAVNRDVEAIKQLKARYFRLLDTKDWAGLRGLFTDDLVVDTTGSGGGVVAGADAFVGFVSSHLAEAVTVHHGHTPEITLTSPSEATGIWAMEDRIWFANGTAVTGFGHYHETYVKIDDAWRISSSTLTRLRVELTGSTTT